MSNKVISELDRISQNNLSSSDSILVNDASDENRIKRTTIQDLSANNDRNRNIFLGCSR